MQSMRLESNINQNVVEEEIQLLEFCLYMT